MLIYMEKETNQKMYTVVSVYKRKEQRTMKFVQLTSEQFGLYFPMDSLREFSNISTLPSEKERKIGIISVKNMLIGSTKQIVVELKQWSFTKRFSNAPIQVFTKCGVRYPKPTEDNTEIEEQPVPVVELPLINVIETEPQSEMTDTVDSTNDESNETEGTAGYVTGPIRVRSLRNDYSLIFRPNVYSMNFQLKRVA